MEPVSTARDEQRQYHVPMTHRKKSNSVTCIDCGMDALFSTILDGEGPLCDACADARLSDVTGYPRLPAPPPSEMIVGPDRRRHKIDYRIWRSPGGIAVEAVETRNRGYHVEVVGSQFDDVPALVERVRSRIRERIGRLELERSSLDGHWTMAGWEVNGRFEWNEDSDLYDVVIDGRRLTWEEFGEMVDSFEGWEFKLSINTEGLPDEVLAPRKTTPAPPADDDPAFTEPEDEKGAYKPSLQHLDSSHLPPSPVFSPEREPRVH